ncbi:MAG: hypothetical protein CO187_03490 [Zetaproteobacteria bacterium CG_4_9_14_3_um_filter_53_7]|nr:MAG: hypothetical protein CO187_03490 [Zetaproteobacteria bacterium CG_4_9_14_3_um_filter_53_7]
MPDHFTKQQEESPGEQSTVKVESALHKHHKPRVFMPFDLVGLLIIAIVAYFYFQPDEPVQAPAMVAIQTATTAIEETAVAESDQSIQADESTTPEAPADQQTAAPVAELDQSIQADGITAPEAATVADNEEAAPVAEVQQPSRPETTIAMRPLLSDPEEVTDASAAAVTNNPVPVTPDAGQTVLPTASKPAIFWAVNLLSTTSRPAAERLNLRLQANGTPSELIAIKLRGQTYYRIRVADFSSYQQADEARQSFRATTAYKDAWVSRHSNK